MQEDRKWIILGIFLLTGLIFLVKLFFIQVYNHEYELAANDNSVKKITVYPHRGVILDRNGKELVVNAPVYDIMVTTEKAQIRDTSAFCELLGISPKDLISKIEEVKKDRGYASNKPMPFVKQISKIDFAKIQDRLIEYPGFTIQSRTVRAYPHQSLANALGYIGEISPRNLEADVSGYYRMGDYVGISGIEAAYEQELRGKKGVRHVWVDALGREKGKFQAGALDTPSVAGKRLISTIDLELQKYGEQLMQNKKGAVVAIEPATGEILSMISAPSYDPNLLTGREFRKNYGRLLLDEHKPLFNRAIQAKYPPGSTFKTIQALIGMQEGVINKHSAFACNRALVNCHGHPPADLHRSIQYSCNPYYYRVYRRIIYQNKIIDNDSANVTREDGDHRVGFVKWRKYLESFNLGRKTGVDLVNELDGLVPTMDLYDNRYGKEGWKFSNIYSLGIGQGELGVLPIQLANAACIIANRGYYRKPHLIKKIGNQDKRAMYQEKHVVPIDRKHFDLVVDGMRDAYKQGTVAYYAILKDIAVCSKTGTAQNPHGEDHSVFIAFAPKDNPKIVVAAYVENAGFGGVWAAPVAALMIEKYLKGKISEEMEWTEQYVTDKKFIEDTPSPIDLPETDSEDQPNQDRNRDTTNQKKENVLAIGN